MTPQTPPTDRPLTAGDVPLLREGDVLIAGHTNFHTIGELVRYAGVSMNTEYVCFIKIEGKPGHYSPDTFTFTARPAPKAVPAARPATSAASEGAVDRVMAVLNHWFDGRARIDRNSEMVAQLAALASPPVSKREREAIDRLKKGIWTGKKDSTTVNMCDLNDALAVIRRLTAQPAGEPTHG